MSTTFILLTLLFVVVSVAMVLIILVQRPQGGGLAGAFGGAGGGGTESVFGGRVGDALTWATVIAFVVYLGIAISLNLIGDEPADLGAPTPIDVTTEASDTGAATPPLRVEPNAPPVNVGEGTFEFDLSPKAPAEPE